MFVFNDHMITIHQRATSGKCNIMQSIYTLDDCFKMVFCHMDKKISRVGRNAHNILGQSRYFADDMEFQKSAKIFY